MKPPDGRVEDAPRRGRPPGEVTPESLIRQELIAHLKLYRRIREVIETRMDDVNLDADTLAKYMDLLRKGIGDLAKSVVPNARPTEAKPDDGELDGEAILLRMIEGAAR